MAAGMTRRILASQSLPAPPGSLSPAELARNEAFWREVAGYYDRTVGTLNLEHGYWGKMARPVQAVYLEATHMVNTQNSFYGRNDFPDDETVATSRISAALGVHEDEIVITRNATEAIDNLIRQYRGLEPGTAVLMADIDYPHFKSAIRWLETEHGVRVVEIVLPTRASQAQILDRYVRRGP
jgi:hypothetical protein